MQAVQWRETFSAFGTSQFWVMLFFGMAAGMPLLLIFSTLGLWLREAGIDRSTVTLFSWAALGYSFKFTWAPLVDRLPLPILTRRLGRRRGWLLMAQLSIVCAIIWMANTDPATGSLTTLALAAVLLGFASATQDIVIDAYRIESADKEMQAILSSSYIAGYRIGMLIAGAGALFLASFYGSSKSLYHYTAWQNTYYWMAASMGIGILTTLLCREPDQRKSTHAYQTRDHLRLTALFLLAILGLVGSYWGSAELATSLKATLTDWFTNKALAGFVSETLRLALGLGVAIGVAMVATRVRLVKPEMVEATYLAPVRDFFTRYGLHISLLILSLVGLYRISDIVLGVIANVFYQDLGFSKTEIATVVKTFGLIMTIAGGFLGGLLALRIGVMRTLLLGAIMTVVTNLLFIVLARTGANIEMLYLVISADNITAGLASAAFIAFLSQLTNIEFTATQYAIFSSLMTLIPKVLGGYSGSIVDALGYETFFLIASLIGIPIIFLVVWVEKRLT